MSKVLDEINEYSSGIMNLNLIKGKTESEISVVDMNYVETDQNDLAIQEANFNDLFTFDIMSPNSIVKDYNLPTAFSIPRIFFDTFSK